MSRQLPIRPEQGSYSQFQLETSQPKPPHKRDEDILAKLRDSIPQNESQWQQARQLHSYATAEHVLQKTKDILENRVAKQDLRNFISIATCCTYWHLGRKKEAYDHFRLQIGFATELTIQRYMSSVRCMIQALNPLYRQGLQHRVFEVTLLYVRISPSFLTCYTKNSAKFNSCFPQLKVEPEIQASLALSPAFILKYRHPEHSYKDICQALGTSVLDEEAYAGFISVLDSGRPIPHMLPVPEQVPEVAPSSDDIFALPKTFALLFKAFDTSEALKRLVQMVRELIDPQSLREIPNTPLLEHQWTAQYDEVVDQSVRDLIQQGILPQQPFHRIDPWQRHAAINDTYNILFFSIDPTHL
ncbi:hypothetical protein FBEOM_3053 [Fusarium beomiforme]|uniref:Uncharacterized protein n=1 Tax=Fusarium beomiforme TaxID=44412 RepID=A0A9P5AQ92_9HYPO|nr:hypothetical protein FBEOM_3053 [Fusarium beomiforme]